MDTMKDAIYNPTPQTDNKELPLMLTTYTTEALSTLFEKAGFNAHYLATKRIENILTIG